MYHASHHSILSGYIRRCTVSTSRTLQRKQLHLKQMFSGVYSIVYTYTGRCGDSFVVVRILLEQLMLNTVRMLQNTAGHVYTCNTCSINGFRAFFNSFFLFVLLFFVAVVVYSSLRFCVLRRIVRCLPQKTTRAQIKRYTHMHTHTKKNGMIENESLIIGSRSGQPVATCIYGQFTIHTTLMLNRYRS